MSTSFAIVGAFGRLGSRIVDRVATSFGTENVYTFGREETLEFEGVDVVIDVALPDATCNNFPSRLSPLVLHRVCADR